MNNRGAFMNVNFTESDSPSSSGDSQTSTYSELNFRKDERLIDEGEDPPIASGPGELRVTAQTDGLTSPYSELNFRKDDPLTDEDEDPPIASRPRRMLTAAQTAAQEKESKVKIGNRPHRLICLLCLVTSVLMVIVAGLSIHVSQNRHSKETCNRNYYELNSTLQSKLSELNSNLSDIKRRHSDLRHQFTEMETKYRSVNETNAQISEADVSSLVPDIRILSEPRVQRDGNGLKSTYSELNFRKDNPLIDEDEYPPIASDLGVLPVATQAVCCSPDSVEKASLHSIRIVTYPLIEIQLQEITIFTVYHATKISVICKLTNRVLMKWSI
ncbi:uncharacterized protein LOC132388810 [Hypanus sabinus]|uniref:uncharacterized protein LOC132388810 n=1 Tax=Hypanus sabinus TaxID=79690 RepID=UPI0028C42C5F|nr:uncharacterized protein LOC132388810 [Hypanus sabinus]